MELSQSLGISQPTLSRRLKEFPIGDVHRIGQGRSTRYALHKDIESLGSHWPLYEIRETGEARRVAVLHALENGSWHVEEESNWPSIHSLSFPNGLYPDWPWFLDDLRPQGFLGKLFAADYAGVFQTPADPRQWSASDTVAALLRRGQDTPGGFVLGEKMLSQALSAQHQSLVPTDSKLDHYDQCAKEVLEGNWPGSSAAGEQPKFTSSLVLASGHHQPVIVKFTGDVQDPVQTRRADLLIAEHLVNQVLIDARIPTAKTHIYFHNQRCYLESIRFDRTLAKGRKHLISLFALNAALIGGVGEPWYKTARIAEEQRWLTKEAADTLRLLWWFGRCIGNTDMHDGNVSLRFAPEFPLSLAPVYDMSPMALHPRGDGSLPEKLPEVPYPPPEEQPAFEEAKVLSKTFKSALQNSAQISTTFKQLFAGS